MLSEDILYLPIRQLGEQIRQRKLSPVELTKSYLERSDVSALSCMHTLTITTGLALRQAQAAETDCRGTIEDHCMESLMQRKTLLR